MSHKQAKRYRRSAEYQAIQRDKEAAEKEAQAKKEAERSVRYTATSTEQGRARITSGRGRLSSSLLAAALIASIGATGFAPRSKP